MSNWWTITVTTVLLSYERTEPPRFHLLTSHAQLRILLRPKLNNLRNLPADFDCAALSALYRFGDRSY